MLRTLSLALAFALCVASYAQAADKPSTKPSRSHNQQMQSAKSQPYQTAPSDDNENIAPPSDDMVHPSADSKQPSKGKRTNSPNKKPGSQPYQNAPSNNNGENMAPPPDGKQPSKGKRPNKKPDSQPGGDMTPPELQ